MPAAQLGDAVISARANVGRVAGDLLTHCHKGHPFPLPGRRDLPQAFTGYTLGALQHVERLHQLR
jgi:hypothetical protein